MGSLPCYCLESEIWEYAALSHSDAQYSQPSLLACTESCIESTNHELKISKNDYTNLALFKYYHMTTWYLHCIDISMSRLYTLFGRICLGYTII